MKTYEAIFDENDQMGVYGISLVKRPAMEGTFIALAKQEPIQFKTADKEQRKVVGLVLEPNKLIYRFDEQTKEEYNIVFSEDTIKNLAYNFFKQNFQKNSTIEHNQKIEGVTFVESWIVEDVKFDKQALYGFEYPKGSWLVVLKIDNEDIWNNYVKTGKVIGFSIDGYLPLREIELNKNTNKMTEILNEIKDLIKTSFSKKEVKLGMIKTADGNITIEWEGDVLESGLSVWITTEDGNKVPVPVGEHPLEDGKILVVETEGIVASIKEVEETKTPEVEASQITEQVNNDAAISQEIANAIKSILIKYNESEKRLKDIEVKLSEVIKENKELMVALSETPAVKKVNAVPTQLNKQQTLIERLNNKLN